MPTKNNHSDYQYPANNLAKSNVLIQSKYKVTTFGNKIMALGLYYLQKGDYVMSKSGGNLVCVIPVKDIRERLNWSGNSIYRDLDRVSDALTDYKFGYKDPEKKEFTYINLFTSITYRDGELAITFNGDMKEYLTALEQNYTILNLPLMLQWQRAYTFRLFELLSSEVYKFKETGYRCVYEMNLAEFKFQIGCYDVDTEIVRSVLKAKKISSTDYELAETAIVEAVEAQKEDGKGKKKHLKQYLKWYDFNRIVLEPAIEEINATPQADMFIDKVETLKKGRGGKVYALRIHYRTHLSANKEENAPEIIETVKMTEDDKMDFVMELGQKLVPYGMKARDIRIVAEKANWNMEVCTKAISILEKTEAVNNAVAFLIKAIDEDWDEPISVTNGKKKGFSNFEQHDYDFEALEKELTSNFD